LTGTPRRLGVEAWSLVLGFLLGVAVASALTAFFLGGVTEMVEEQINVTVWLKANVNSDAYRELLNSLDRAVWEGEDAVVPAYLAQWAQSVLYTIVSWTMLLDLESVYASLEAVRRGLIIVAALAMGGALGLLLRRGRST